MLYYIEKQILNCYFEVVYSLALLIFWNTYCCVVLNKPQRFLSQVILLESDSCLHDITGIVYTQIIH